jgi:hypothetical protein
MWSGQSAGLVRRDDAIVFLRELVADVEPVARAVASWAYDARQAIHDGAAPTPTSDQ